MKIFSCLLILSALFLASCQVVPVKNATLEHTKIYLPPVGEKATVSMGERMMLQGVGYKRECLTTLIKKQATDPITWITSTISPNTKFCAHGIGGNSFSYESGPITSAYTVVTKENDDNTKSLCVNGMSPCMKYLSSEIRLDEEFKYEAQNLQQTIEYMGRDKNSLSFIYAEFTNGMARQAFNREFILNLDHGHVLNFKGAEVEVVSADNQKLTYVIKKYFD